MNCLNLIKDLKNIPLYYRSMTESRFITTDDNKADFFMYKLPITWWSRPYEYEWCKNFIDKNDIVLDAASEIIHPLRFYLADNCKQVFACDLNKDITTDISNYNFLKI